MSCSHKDLLFGIVATIAVLGLIIFVIVTAASGFGPGIQAELTGAGGGTILDGTNVLFNNVLNTQGAGISYNPATGLFTITIPGNYTVAWWTAPDGAGPATSISFAVAVNGVPYSTASSPIVSGQMAAQAFVTISTVPSTISLVNVTGDDVFVPTIPVQAGIVITR